MVFDKNVTNMMNLADKNFSWGQRSDGKFYCKEFKTDTVEEADEVIESIIKMLSTHNKDAEKTDKIELKRKKE